jgi:hypothetical protein
MADAIAAEQEHRAAAASGRPSPLEGVAYDATRHEHDLLRPADSPVDAAVLRLVEAFDHAGTTEREDLRSRLSLNDFYTLITFARRSCVRALRDDDARPAVAGLTALVMVDADRVDWRDVLVALALVSFVLRELGGGVDSLFNDAISRATPGVAEMLVRFIRPSSEDLDPVNWGVRLVETTDGLGLVDTGYEFFDPSVDLLGMSLAVSDAVEGDEYRMSSPRIAERLPVVWLPGADPKAANRVVDSCVGCVVLSGRLNRGGVNPGSQQITVFLVEAGSEDDAEMLERWASGGSHAALGVRHGSLFCLVVARSFVEGVAAHETADSLERFAPVLRAVLGG